MNLTDIICISFWGAVLGLALHHLGFSCGDRRLLSSCHAQLLLAVASLVAEHGLSCSTACGIFPDQGSNLCPLHWQADSYPLATREVPLLVSFKCL